MPGIFLLVTPSQERSDLSDHYGVCPVGWLSVGPSVCM